jgi:hypothetical protein
MDCFEKRDAKITNKLVEWKQCGNTSKLEPRLLTAYLQQGGEKEGEDDASAASVVEHSLQVAKQTRADDGRYGGQQTEGDLVPAAAAGRYR